jgi:hypothetical protein
VERVATSGACGESFEMVDEVLVGGSSYTVNRARERMIVCLMIGSFVVGSMGREPKHASR